ncbi:MULTISPECIES: signal peptide peptidase SppA [Spongiibacter]|uniref:signal peptide peptidase SppA n=1 Tax=Spongiibacter TaxID=630749 RepID=UPI000C600692|nr:MULTISPECIES: signal peptide peptidase SppA [Spongiibacter]MBI58811.1 signal peptide peptidase SppA [Spongiibacter sp.]|tara:strand:- start:4017 stop:5831 length:1815 start_codon:yes stop_codon:yes gene_type:complete
MSQKNRGFFSRMLAVIDAMRRWIVNLLFLFFFGFMLFSLYNAFRIDVPGGGALVLMPEGNVVEEYTAVDALTQLSADGQPQETLLQDLIDAVDYAREDSSIKVMLLLLDDLQHIGMAKGLELGEALQRFRESGKEIVAMSGSYDQDSYLLAANADRVLVHNMGGVSIEGFSVVRNYLRDALEKLKVTMHVFKVGSYKSAVEPLLRNDMSEEAREANRGWLEPLWDLYRDRIVAARNITVNDFDYYVNNIDRVLAGSGGDAAQAALDYGLVDGIVSRPTLSNMMAEQVGWDEDGYFNQVYYRNYLRFKRAVNLPNNDAGVGVIIASGNIVDGDQPPGTIGGDSLARLVRQARLDNKLKALVLRVDSGGGSAFASEVIRAELEALQQAGKPLVVSMSSMAASGGYWIAAGADEIWASPATLTGSIGIFGAFPTAERLLEDLGVHTDGIGTTAVAGKLRVDRPLDPIVARAIQRGIEHGYQRFINVVAEGRGKLPEQVKPIAEGRVWSGMDAHELGLVDRLGGLDGAITSAAQLAGLSDDSHRVLRLPLSPEEELLRWIMEAGVVSSQWLPASVSTLLQQWLPSVKALPVLNDPRGVYAQCLLCAAP